MGQEKNIKASVGGYCWRELFYLGFHRKRRLLLLKNISKIIFVLFLSLAVMSSFALADPREGNGKQGKEQAYKQKKDKSGGQGDAGSESLISVSVRYEDVRPR